MSRFLCERLEPKRMRLGRLLVVMFACACSLAGPLAANAAAGAVNNVPPEVIGKPQVGEKLLCYAGSWSGVVSDFEYTWVRDGSVAGNGRNYLTTSADAGHNLWCVVTALPKEGHGEARSVNSVHIPGALEEPPSAPAGYPQLSGTPAPGHTLTCVSGTWGGNPTPTLAYRWVRDKGLPDQETIASAKSSTYQVVEADEGYTLACRVTATNSEGEASAVSNSLKVPGAPPANVVLPWALGSSEAVVGEVLSCSPGVWSGHPTPILSYQWLRDGSPIVSGTAQAYLVEEADRLHSLSCNVTARNSEGSAEAHSRNAISVRGTPPELIRPPKVSPEVAAVGEVLTCSPGSWGGEPPPEFKYLWRRDELAIAGSSSATYEAKAEDSGHRLSCEVTATNGQGSPAKAASNSAVVKQEEPGDSPPVAQVAPAVSGQTAVRDTLTCSQGTWSGNPAPTLNDQWLRDGAPIASATSTNYTITTADQGHSLACEVSASNRVGIVHAVSSSVRIPGEAPAVIVGPQATGEPVVGAELTCLRGEWRGEPPPVFTYQWLRDGAPLASATASTYTVSNADRGRWLSCQVTAANSEGAEEVTSGAIEIPGSAPGPISKPVINGTPAVGDTLTCDPGTWSGAPTPIFSYEWLRTGESIPGATASEYTVAPADRSEKLVCQVTATNHYASASERSNADEVAGERPTPSEAPEVVGVAAVGEQLTCRPGRWQAEPPPELAYQWLRDGTSISSANESTYTVELSDEGHGLSCMVTASNSAGTVSAISVNSLAIPLERPATNLRELILSPVSGTLPPPSPAQILAGLRGQLEHRQHRARLSAVRKAGAFAFPFFAMTAGRLEFSWYEAPSGAQHGSGARPLELAFSSTFFPTSSAKNVQLRLTSAGRRVLSQNKQIKLLVKAAFTRSRQRAVTWSETVTLSH